MGLFLGFAVPSTDGSYFTTWTILDKDEGSNRHNERPETLILRNKFTPRQSDHPAG
ncbi:hypothetical protein NTG1052_180031 [Candidatus Nitrotoga sp. 1052]|nr:hypothetical protein NTG1052_180031 [Candidatus Nitrotoga sp. 1052]